MYIGYRDRQILTISDQEIKSDNLKILKVPSELQQISREDLFENYIVKNDEIIRKNFIKDLKQAKIALIGVYQIKCGVSTYAEAIFPKIGEAFGDYKIFAESNNSQSNDPHLIRCWQRGNPLSSLIDQIHTYDPDVILIQHEYGLFPIARYWLSFMSEMQKYKTFVTLHSVYEHKDKTICEAVIPNIIVHTLSAKQILKENKKINGNIYVIPHFCKPCLSNDKYWNIHYSDHTIIQFGFGFKYKGWEQSLEAVTILKKDFNDVFFTGLFSESDFSKSFHERYFYELQTMIKNNDLTDNVALIRGFQNDQILESFFRTHQVAIFPYKTDPEFEVHACSGAARSAMSFGINTIVSNVALFEDLEGICPRISNSQELSQEIKKLFLDKTLAQKQLQKQNEFLLERNLSTIVDHYLTVLKEAPQK